MKIEAIAKDTHNPANINNPTDHLIQEVRTAMRSNSSKKLLRCSASNAFKYLARSIALPNRFTNTPKIEPMPVNKNTGATAS